MRRSRMRKSRSKKRTKRYRSRSKKRSRRYRLSRKIRSPTRKHDSGNKSLKRYFSCFGNRCKRVRIAPQEEIPTYSSHPESSLKTIQNDEIESIRSVGTSGLRNNLIRMGVVDRTSIIPVVGGDDDVIISNYAAEVEE